MPEDFYFTWNQQDIPAQLDVAGAEDDEFILTDGRRIFDFASTSFQCSFGHSNETIRQRIHQQLDRMPIASPKSVFELKRSVSEKLIRLLNVQHGGRASGRIFYTVSGAESVENALKIARHFTGRAKVLARQRSYHGATLGAMSVSGDWRSHDHLNFSEGTVRIPEPYDDPEGRATRQIIERIGGNQIAACIVETISGVNGVIVPPQSWWDSIRHLCDEFGILLIADEVLVGFGRTGTAFGIHHFNARPDMVCMSKAITGGYVPFGAVWTSEAIARRYDRQVLACGLTNYAHPLGLAALDGVLEILQDERFQENKAELESIFSRELRELAERDSISDIRFRGLLAAIEFETSIPSWTDFLQRGLYLVTKESERMVILAPPLISKPQRMLDAFTIFKETIDQAAVDATLA